MELLGLGNNSTAAGVRSAESSRSILLPLQLCQGEMFWGNIHVETRVYCSCGSECLCEEEAAAHFFCGLEVFADQKGNFIPLG